MPPPQADVLGQQQQKKRNKIMQPIINIKNGGVKKCA